MAAGKGNMERIRRGIRTVFFMLTMVASLLVLSLPILVAAGDVLVSFALISSFSCVGCYGFRDHLQRYGFRSSLIDIPFVSVVRSVVITCKIGCLAFFVFLIFSSLEVVLVLYVQGIVCDFVAENRNGLIPV